MQWQWYLQHLQGVRTGLATPPTVMHQRWKITLYFGLRGSDEEK
jgi:hypothetical protein